MRFKELVLPLAAWALAVTGGFLVGSSMHKAREAHKASAAPSNLTTIYVQNLAPRYISSAEIRHDIPAWERAVNTQFAPLWHSEHYRIVLRKGPAPKGSISAVFVKRGPIKGALAYHTVENGVPRIVVYAGTDDYYGYGNSVSFTHELFELAADAPISVTNQGWPYDWVWLQKPQGFERVPQDEGTVWAQEVCDPVEALSYRVDGVEISDFVTPNWFSDDVNGGFDYMGAVQQPFTILAGGYAQYWNGMQWSAITNFRKAVASDAGFYRGEEAKHDR